MTISTPPEWLTKYPVEVVNYEGNLGPAKARNRGFGLRADVPEDAALTALDIMSKRLEAACNPEKPLPDYLKDGFYPELKYRLFDDKPDVFVWDSDVHWYYFTDCGCTHDPNLFLSFEKAWEDCGDCCVAVSGPVTGIGGGPINEFMTEQGILNPPLERNLHGVYIPQAIVTANVLVTGLPFAFLGGFDPAFPEAAGEDLDLGIRLREFGVIAWAKDARVSHRFAEDERDFVSRFRRYGRGNRRLEVKHQLPNLRAKKFRAEKRELQRLADLAVSAMRSGYDEATLRLERGILRIL